MACYWWTSSFTFANPAVTIARTFTNTFSGISLNSWPRFFAGQLIGLIVGLPFAEFIFGKKTLMSSILIFLTCKTENYKPIESKTKMTKNILKKIKEIKEIFKEMD